MKDPRETAIDVEKGVIWEQGNRKEDRWKWNGSWLDLCDMPTSEYVKNPIVEAIKACGSGKSIVVTTVTFYSTCISGDTSVKVEFSGDVKSDFYAVLNYNGAYSAPIAITSGCSSPFYIFSNSGESITSVESLYIGATIETCTGTTYEDSANYMKYVMLQPEITTVPVIREQAIVGLRVTSAMTDSALTELIKELQISGVTPTRADENDAEVVFTIKGVPVEGYNEMTEEEIYAVALEKAAEYILIVTKQISKVYDELGNDDSSNWKLNTREITVNDIKYYVSTRDDDEGFSQTNIYDASEEPSEDYIFKYKITY